MRVQRRDTFERLPYASRIYRTVDAGRYEKGLCVVVC